MRSCLIAAAKEQGLALTFEYLETGRKQGLSHARDGGQSENEA